MADDGNEVCMNINSGLIQSVGGTACKDARLQEQRAEGHLKHELMCRAKQSDAAFA